MLKSDFVMGDANLRLRILSALVMAPVALALTWFGGLLFAILVLAAAVLGLFEWLRLVNPVLKDENIVLAEAFLAIVLLLGTWLSPAIGVTVGFFLTPALYVLAARDGNASAPLVALGIPYLAGGGMALLYLREFPVIGFQLVVFLFFVVWATDCGAYAAGKLIGGPKLAPVISPNKTWAGLLGGMALAAIAGYAAAYFLGARHPLAGLAIAVLLADTAQAGDLFKSTFKRRAGVKESGTLIPGHGGVLDRIDGLVFAAIFFALFEAASGARLNWW